MISGSVPVAGYVPTTDEMRDHWARTTMAAGAAALDAARAAAERFGMRGGILTDAIDLADRGGALTLACVKVGDVARVATPLGDVWLAVTGQAPRAGWTGGTYVRPVEAGDLTTPTGPLRLIDAAISVASVASRATASQARRPCDPADPVATQTPTPYARGGALLEAAATSPPRRTSGSRPGRPRTRR